MNVHEQHNLGYGKTTYIELLKTELNYQKTRFATETLINFKLEGRPIRAYKMRLPVIENKIICNITAIKDKIDFYDIARIRTYLKALGLHIGILINFGKKDLEIRGIDA